MLVGRTVQRCISRYNGISVSITTQVCFVTVVVSITVPLYSFKLLVHFLFLLFAKSVNDFHC
jgi:hypothetical protein